MIPFWYIAAALVIGLTLGFGSARALDAWRVWRVYAVGTR